VEAHPVASPHALLVGIASSILCYNSLEEIKVREDFKKVIQLSPCN
jgi:hypothetical protein